ncbi:nitrate reductase molybdenum cofactor assembly chaperone [Sulfolobus sp. E5-1-F]|uniref:nitrate reductase molybdenum cofactor assembly chaperone n=1 Tax=Sulfolobaceae TaxID=118883 RepID=UPI001295B816|nr:MULTISPECIES: nitrate reductase molybdenum cofactor assembly chaperone [unclassified Sulfolobus]QGA54087.1 nitrate reductase molybdenum cofactor assembly chaperone [Sulfolobus sp. E5-1-F]QGA69149.1 nitrate reductase molybdenum cofactor assembly chaperone [Sulfolobus sp. E11-6]
MKTLQLVKKLLEYPSIWMKEKEEIINQIIQTSSPYRQFLLRFLENISNYKQLDLEEIYVNTFDNNDYTTLYMTYYITGEERERIGLPKRGLLLAWLKERVKIANNELPDYLPILLEYLDNHDDEEVKKLIQEPMKILLNRLKERNSIFYPLVFTAYLELYGGINYE